MTEQVPRERGMVEFEGKRGTSFYKTGGKKLEMGVSTTEDINERNSSEDHPRIWVK